MEIRLSRRAAHTECQRSVDTFIHIPLVQYL